MGGWPRSEVVGVLRLRWKWEQGCQGEKRWMVTAELAHQSEMMVVAVDVVVGGGNGRD